MSDRVTRAFDDDHRQARYGASVFWVRPSMLFGESIDEFVRDRQIKRDGSSRGIVEVTA